MACNYDRTKIKDKAIYMLSTLQHMQYLTEQLLLSLQNTFFTGVLSLIHVNLNGYIPRLCRWSSNESMHKYLRPGYDQPNP